GEDSSSLRLLQNSAGLILKKRSELNEKESGTLKTAFANIWKNSGENFFTLWNLSFFREIHYLKIPDNYHSSEPLVIESSFKDYSPSNLPLIIIEAGRFSNASLVLRAVSPVTEDLHLIAQNFYVHISESANLNLSVTEEFNASTWHFSDFHIIQEADSAFKCSYLNLGGFRGKTFFNAGLDGKNSRAELQGAGVFSKREVQDAEFIIRHSEDSTESSLRFRTVVRNRAHHIFTGILQVPKHLKKVSASQVNNNLLFDRTARAESMPKLEVYAEDVKCSHGATMGEVDREEMFYLESRGITPEEARMLIVEGYLSEILDSIGNEKLKEEILERLIRKAA
ncbi:MAG TPA: SufD family Fe-S cluster assembly protein, partial [Leptospiraceae bacterium]|nr:SufD family Fe-S cluster assembly protein [Leptospiraceae bacterium]